MMYEEMEKIGISTQKDQIDVFTPRKDVLI